MNAKNGSKALEAWWDQGAVAPDRPLLLIAGPCVLESSDINRKIADTLAEAADQAGMRFVFKASFDKANRSSVHSDRGPGIESGLAELAAIGESLGVPTLTDVHEPSQAAACAAAVDMLQVPAFLCRQTDLLTACGETGLPVAVKKGQFLSPGEMQHVLEKLRDGGCPRMMATERGTFFGYQRLVNDFIGIGDLQELAASFNAPVCFDVTHSTQLPGGAGSTSGGRPERAPMLARAAVAAGVEALFLECHPNPAQARSDASTVLSLDTVPALLRSLGEIRRVISGR